MCTAGNLAFVENVLFPFGTEIQATDGAFYIRAAGANDTLNCTITRDQTSVKELLSNENSTVKYLGKLLWQKKM